MQATIIISGQYQGNTAILRKLSTYGQVKVSESRFNGFYVHYETKANAVKAMREAYNGLCQDEPEKKGKLSGIRASKDRTVLYYDASQATID